MLDEAAKHHPDTWWWLKADGCDIVSGLAESMRGVWSGDVDLNDGNLHQQYKLYQDRLSRITSLKLSSNLEEVCIQIASMLCELKDLVYLQNGKCWFLNFNMVFMCNSCYIVALTQAQKHYEDKVSN